MSKYLKLFVPALGGTALLLVTSYHAADLFVNDLRPDPSQVIGAAATDEIKEAPAPAVAPAETATVIPAQAVSTQSAPMVLASAPLGLGRAALPEEVAAWNGEISADGTGLPEGSGDAIVGEEIFAAQCAACHGDFAEGIDNWPKLAGGADTLDHDDPLKTVGSYWPYLSTAFDYIKRSMPYGNAGTLSDDETYAIVAYILYSNDMIDDDFVLSKETFFDVEMPNADGFIIDDRPETEYAIWSGEPCMENCKPAPVEVTMRAMVLDVTPQEEGAAEPEAEAEPVVVAAAFDEALAAKGEKVFRKCKSCHQVGDGAKNRVGPVLNGIVGSAAGSVDGFEYSKPMAAAGEEGLIWTEAELAAFLADPKGYMKRTKMAFAGLKKEDDQLAVIEYLKSYGE
jgi:S-disulfanyl-L-cysteine oxidoreductase SoxD